MLNTADGTTARLWEQEKFGAISFAIAGALQPCSRSGSRSFVGFRLSSYCQEHFEGASRRFEFRGEANGIVFIDDYAHH